MVGERRSPGVQHGGEPDARAEMLGVGCNGDQGLGRDLEQQVIDDRLVVIGDVGDRSRQGEDDMEVGNWQQFGLAVGQPLLGSDGLALRTMPVAAGIVGDAQVGALRAAFDMAAQSSGAASFDRGHHPPLPAAEMTGMDLAVSGTVAAEDLRHLDRWP